MMKMLIEDTSHCDVIAVSVWNRNVYIIFSQHLYMLPPLCR